MLGTGSLKRVLTAAFIVAAAQAACAADGEPWSVSKFSGEVWVITPGAAQVSLGSDNVLNPGDTIRTGSSGRALLTRGAETILIAPNSVVGLPTEAKDGMATTILQRAGSILLDVEKRNVQHFEVETPYLAAVVKGTQFSVTIEASSTKVEVSRGQVEVADFKSGQIAQVMAGQAATAFAHGKAGLSLSGSGSFSPIEQGRPRASSIDRVPVPKGGLQAPRGTNSSVIHALQSVGGSMKSAAVSSGTQPGTAANLARPNVVRISAPLGEVKLNVHQATHGLAHGGATPGIRSGSHSHTVWSDTNAGVSSANNSSSTNASSNTSNATGDASVAAAVTAAVGSSSGSAGSNGNSSNGNALANNGNGNGNGNSGGNGNNGNGNAGGNGNSENSNAGGNGNGHAYGHTKN
ncbi:FecR domain-containing protein [Bradyrhizobium sp. HKCCYLS1011]|uniref:FecR domain-containing protein n=1 Tax=Bradyrhizobium sp. HKCCYLS1011 TaxID=3420733 RepID=UPI003EBBC0C9